ncbi:MFS permease [sugar] [Roseibium sp. TrichSKD4]|uniref:MFS transporter n=1 Tax=Roseibium sp. TrichSKD4 TaxID=744980 RepID=UPI0001E56FA1|nr:MFS transporter [Roseibium sp. TrichSKD4]EFO32266.1 MFS permease [sugar] [Roseibium sp. TrichSKD4]
MRVLTGLPKQVALICCLQLFYSACLSMLVPLMSFFIVEGLGSEPWQAGLYPGILLPLTLVANRWIGEKLDQNALVRRFLLLSAFAILVAALSLTQVSSLLALILVVIPFMVLANTGAGTVFTFARFFAESRSFDIDKTNAWVRMTVSLGWMIGPALSYIIVDQSGFDAAFLTAFGLGLVYLVLCWIVVPGDFHKAQNQSQKKDKGGVNIGLLVAGLACVGFTATNSLFVSSMPLFFVTETGLPTSTPGLALAVKCFMEVVVIFVSVPLARRIGPRPVLMISAAMASGSMFLFAQVETVFQVVLVSIVEGVYYGLFAGVAITFVQSFAPDRPGRATAVYMNSLFLGGLIGSVSMGFIASATDYKTVLYVASISSLFALVILVGTKRVTLKPA